MGKLGYMMRHYPHGHRSQHENKPALPHPIAETLRIAAAAALVATAAFIQCDNKNEKNSNNTPTAMAQPPLQTR